MSQVPAPHHIEEFRELIGRRMGLSVDESKTLTLGELLRERLEATGSSCDSYLQALRASSHQAELAPLASALTVGETYFFRNIEQFRALAEVALPTRRAARQGLKPLRILSAGCATGEEPYSLAIIARQALGATVQAHIRAVDINPAMLKKAALGRYAPWVLRETPQEIQERWFRADGGEYVLDDAILASVNLELRNLAADEPDLWEPCSYDIVFCRNVIMYFTPENGIALVRRIARALTEGGYLFLGHAETLRGLSQDFRLRRSHGAFYYERKDRAEGLPLRSAEQEEAATARARFSDRPLPMGSWIDAIGQASGRIARLADETRRELIGDAVTPTRKAPRWDLTAILDLVRQERFAEALHVVDGLPPEAAADPDVLLLLAVLFVQSGQFARAEEACRAILKADEMNAGAHYALALCKEGQGDRQGAADHNRIAAYLDPGFAMPHLHLGRLMRMEGERKAARLELRLALALLEREEPSRLLLFGGGFGRSALLELCRGELMACGEKS
jgi:chemotaxis protein methyltransferase CheR